MRAEILSIGDELISGQTINRNAAWLGEQLQTVGADCRRHLTVGDNLDEIVEAMRASARGSDLLLISGGLGPTDDDLTRRALAVAMHEELVFDPAAFADIESFFSRLGRPMPDVNRVQAMRPASAKCIPNAPGTAPGLAAQWGKCRVFALPGVPREMKAMFQAAVVAELEGRSSGSVVRIRKINTFGAGESWVGDKIKDLMQRGANPTVGTSVHDGVVSVRIYARGRPEEAEAMLGRTTRRIGERLGDLIFSFDEQTMEQVVGTLLLEKRQTVATAESCTGGLLSQLLTSIPGSSAFFGGGWITYSTTLKQSELGIPESLLQSAGAVSAEVAAEMAGAARRNAASDWALAVTGIAGPDGGSAEKPVGLVYIALANAKGCDARRFIFPGGREQVRLRAGQMAMTMLRLSLANLKFEDVVPG